MNANPEPISLEAFQSTAHALDKERQDALADWRTKAEAAAQAESEYQKRKSSWIVRVKAEEKIGVTEAAERVKGDEWVSEAMIERDTAVELVKIAREKVSGIDGKRASLHELARWSQVLARQGV